MGHAKKRGKPRALDGYRRLVYDGRGLLEVDMSCRFDAFEVDTENFELRRDGEPRHVEPLVFDLICFLSANPGRVVSRDEIIEAVWKGRIVSDATVSSCIKSARQALGDNGGAQTYIRTVRGRGFQFMGEVERRGDEGHAPGGTGRAARSGSRRPSLIVLPFQVFGDAAELAAVADGLVENLSTILTRIPFLALAWRSTSFALKGKAVTAGQVAEEIGTDFMLEGSVQRLADTLRVNVQLIETRGDSHLWAQQFEHQAGEAAMTGLLHDILPPLETQLVRAIFHSLRGEGGEMSAQQLLIKAMGLLALKGWHRASFSEASELLRKSIAMQADQPLAHSYLALILGLGHRVGLLERTRTIVQETVSEAERALDLDDLDSNVLGLAGCALADVGETERAVPLLKQAIELNPNNAQAWTALGSAYAIMDRASEAVGPLERGIDISPMDSRLAVWRAVLALVHLRLGDLDQALGVAEQGCQNDEKTYLPRVVLVAVRLMRKEPAAARTALRDALRVKPDLSQSEIDFLVGPQLGAAVGALRQAS